MVGPGILPSIPVVQGTAMEHNRLGFVLIFVVSSVIAPWQTFLHDVTHVAYHVVIVGFREPSSDRGSRITSSKSSPSTNEAVSFLLTDSTISSETVSPVVDMSVVLQPSRDSPASGSDSGSSVVAGSSTPPGIAACRLGPPHWPCRLPNRLRGSLPVTHCRQALNLRLKLLHHCWQFRILPIWATVLCPIGNRTLQEFREQFPHLQASRTRPAREGI